MAEHLTFNQGVRGSNPRWLTKNSAYPKGCALFFVEQRDPCVEQPETPERGKDHSEWGGVSRGGLRSKTPGPGVRIPDGSPTTGGHPFRGMSACCFMKRINRCVDQNGTEYDSAERTPGRLSYKKFENPSSFLCDGGVLLYREERFLSLSSQAVRKHSMVWSKTAICFCVSPLTEMVEVSSMPKR